MNEEFAAIFAANAAKRAANAAAIEKATAEQLAWEARMRERNEQPTAASTQAASENETWQRVAARLDRGEDRDG